MIFYIVAVFSSYPVYQIWLLAFILWKHPHFYWKIFNVILSFGFIDLHIAHLLENCKNSKNWFLGKRIKAFNLL